MLADDILGPLSELQRHAESRMLDTCEIRYKTGRKTQDPRTGEQSDEYATRFTTRCRVKSSRTYGTLNQEVGGRTATTVTRELHMPVSAPVVKPGDVAVMVSVHESSDQMLVGATLRLAGPVPGSQTTARRLEVTEVIS